MYNKLFAKLLDSSIWMESEGTRLVWVTLLAAMDEDGFAPFASAPNLAHRARVSLDVATAALATLEAPDQHSSDPDHDGRRIERVPGGWLVLNAPKYREIASRNDQRVATRDRVAKYRAKTRGNAPVTPCNAVYESVTPSEAYTEAETEERKRAARVSRSSGAALAGMLPRDHLNHICSPNFAWCVPEAVHLKLAAKLAPKQGGDVSKAKNALLAWYPTVWASLPPDTVLGDAFKFWGPRFDAAFASAVGPVSAPVKPRDCKHVPPCASDIIHTARYARDMQGVA